MIRFLDVRNFKSVRELKLPLGPVRTFVGPNMAGKSNILSVFRFLRRYFHPKPGEDALGGALAEEGGIRELLWKGGDERILSVRLELENPRDPESGTLQYELELLAGRGDYASVQREALRRKRDDGSVDLIDAEGGRVRLRSSDGSVVSTLDAGARPMQSAPDNWEGAVLRHLSAGWKEFALLPPRMRSLNLTRAVSGLDPSGENLSSWLMTLQTRYPECFERMDRAMRDVFPEIERLINLTGPDGSVLAAARERGLRAPIPLWQMSDGEVVFLAFLSLLYAPPELSGSLYLIEEPENHLHPRLLEVLVTLLRQRHAEIAEVGGHAAQVFFTTHSPIFVDQFELEEIVWVEKRDGATIVRRPADEDALRELVDSKELGLGGLVYSGLLSGKS